MFILNYNKERKRLLNNYMLKIIKKIFQFMTCKYAVVIAPINNQYKVKNFHISTWFIGLSIIFLMLMFAVVIFFTTYSSHMEYQFTGMNTDLTQKTEQLNNYMSQVQKNQIIIETFEKNVNNLFSITGVSNINRYNGTGGNGNTERAIKVTEIEQLKTLAINMSATSNYMNDLYKIIKKQKEFISSIPSIWPVIFQDNHRVGNITQMYGWGKNPILGYERVHTGVDIAWSYGTPIVATANGEITNVDYNPNGLGNNVAIQHSYGFLTKYGHMSKVIVKKGQKVIKGQVIGYMGSTGLSNGDHVHYEIWIGNQVVDPMDYLYIEDALGRK
jgi:murein DD-endopeptidase MepM/ murein hydrolase activator NlpD